MLVQQFKYLHDEDEIWSLKKLKEVAFPKGPYNNSIEAQDVDPLKILNYPLKMEELPTIHAIEETEADMQVDPLIRRM